MVVREVARILTACVLLAGVAVSSCADEPLDRVRVCGDLVVPADLVAVRVAVLDDALSEVSAGVVELDDATRRQLPVEVSVPHRAGRRVVRAQAIGADGVEAGRAEVLVASSADAIVLNLTRACLGQLCPLGQTCLDGGCTITPDASDPRLGCASPEGAR